MKRLACTVITSLCMSANVFAGLSQWCVADGGNGHFYDPVLVSTGIDWEAANAAATARGGYLATITSAQENTFVYNLVSDSAFWRDTGPVNGEGPFLGGYRDPYDSANPVANWHWVTGEPWTYSNWVEIEPSGPEGQNRLQFFGYYARSGALWNDVWAANYYENGYIVEFNVNPVPLPGSVLLGVWAVGYAGYRLRRCRLPTL